MPKSAIEAELSFTQPVRQIVLMLIVLALVGVGVWFMLPALEGIFAANPWLNGAIGFVFAIGVLACFWQMIQLIQSVNWIKSLARQQGNVASVPPSLLAPLAALLRTRGARMQISSSSARSILDSVATRIDEERDITRYLANLLIFLGLLGTFYGLATTVPGIVATIRALAPQEGQSMVDAFNGLMSGIEEQLSGMGTAFSTSLMGLAGSLVIGMLELFAGHGTNRFYRELEEWVSTFTRLGLSSGEGEGAANETGAIAMALDTMVEQMESLQVLYSQADINRAIVDDRLGQLADAVERVAARMEQDAGQSALLRRIAEGQEKIAAALALPEGGAHVDAESRMRLRSIDVQLLRILEEISAGRQESITDLRGDLAALTAAIRQLSRVPPQGRG
jgi:hypothetical protein